MGGNVQSVFSGKTAHLAVAGKGPVEVSIAIYGPGGAVKASFMRGHLKREISRKNTF